MQTARHQINPLRTFGLVYTAAEPAAPSRARELVFNGVFVAMASTVPLAALIALFFRFPVPFVGHMSGVAAVLPALMAVAVYGGLMGGFILVGIAGAIAGMLASFIVDDALRRIWLMRCLSVLSSLIILLAFATLDRVIVTW